MIRTPHAGIVARRTVEQDKTGAELMSVAPTSPSAKTPPSDLETRVAHRKQQLISEIVEHKINSSRFGAAEAIEKIKGRLSELAHIVKAGGVDGWANVSSSAKLKLDEWIAR
jgi:hypothetical protein